MALVPSDIGSSLSSAQDIFTQASDVVQTVGSILDTITGKADATPKPAAATAPAQAPAPVAAPAPSMSTQTKYILLGLGIVVLLAFVGMRK